MPVYQHAGAPDAPIAETQPSRGFAKRPRRPEVEEQAG
jgi:hypothetical protein